MSNPTSDRSKGNRRAGSRGRQRDIRRVAKILRLGGARLYRLRDDFERYPRVEARLTGRVDLALISGGWDEMLRVAGSLKRGYVTAF